MKLLYIYRYSILGGVGTQLANRLHFLLESAEPHFTFLEDHGGRSAFGDYPHTYITPNGKELTRLIRNGNFDMVLVIDTPEAYKSLAAAEYGGKVVNEVHTTTANLKYLADVGEQKIDAFLAPSAYLVERIEGEFGFRGKVPCYDTGNCVDTEVFQPVAGVPVPTRKIILWVGKLDDHKNWRGFLSVAQGLMTRGEDCEFWMVGGETASDDVAREMLDLAGAYELLTRLRWIQRVEYDQMPQLYSLTAASGGLSLSTSQNESFGMTIAESLACGCPAVSARVGAIPEILDGELAQNLYTFFDVDEAINVVAGLLRDDERRRELIEIGRRKASEEYSITGMGLRYMEILERILAPTEERERV